MSETRLLSAGEALVKLLENQGVDTVFGVPGVHTLELYRGLPGRSIRHVLSRHEQGAGFMADGYARMTGKPGVCFVISGPGLTNASTAIGQAYADSVPMLVISSVNPVETLGQGWGELHETQDQRAITAPLTAFSATAYSSEDIPHLIARAFSVFKSERPRPVHIEIPMDVLSAPVQRDWTQPSAVVARRPGANREDVVSAAQKLQGAQQPVIVVGGGALGCGTDIERLADQLGAAVFSTVAAKGLLSQSHPLNGGSVLCLEQGWQFVENADVVLAIGTELASTDLWRDKLDLRGQLIRVDLDPRKMHDRHPAAQAILADASSFTQQLLGEIGTGEASSKRHQVISRLSELRAEVIASYDVLTRKHTQVLDVLRQELPEDAFIVTDMTQIAYTGNHYYPVEHSRTWLHPVGFGTLGYALPAAIGAKIAEPTRVGVVLAGDGGFLYTLQELATAVEELDSPLIVLVWNNDSLGQIRDDMVALDIPPIGVSPSNPDYLKIAEGFGCQVSRPKTLAELPGMLAVAMEFGGVTFVEVHEAIV
ncbi:5-guanidino-2-oxopentanoate decarboxylase [Marinobacter sp. DY40_1A1]|uniref:5-guanidino-2-oxopentanoate decarboxylase n=1 Tax=Marinobacter sp. DY40_1A1 TaxID=2583229 RepID=UPI001906F674|nr:5-guanidino-2-oxopentanoate decarboxylase [Marinobacter sp. DY40_1A1]MBK1885632.1 5-guanidino-2-oxopentanoate decarboxylase [Marinobacter sp. DY40_1A1]